VDIFIFGGKPAILFLLGKPYVIAPGGIRGALKPCFEPVTI
jgi:hypothetical protein